jgi:choline dehydrogenase-like flavoprotein
MVFQRQKLITPFLITAAVCSITPLTELLKRCEQVGPQILCPKAPLAVGGWHLMGTARMGTDPQQSVVNEWGT